MNLPAYLDRIAFDGIARPDLKTLKALHRAHVHTVPFENLDVQLRRPLNLDVAAIYEKIVGERRGGWCYELNGLLGWALEQVGFEVMRVSAGVMREIAGDANLGNHLCLLVQLDRPYLVDVGFGGSLIEPLTFERGSRVDSPYQVELLEADAGYWRFIERDRGAPFSFDFKPTSADESLLATKCLSLQTDAASPFVQNLVAKRRVGNTYLTLRGRVFTRTDEEGETKIMIDSPAQLLECLRVNFELDVPEVSSLWPAISARHEAVFEHQASRQPQ